MWPLRLSDTRCGWVYGHYYQRKRQQEFIAFDPYRRIAILEAIIKDKSLLSYLSASSDRKSFNLSSEGCIAVSPRIHALAPRSSPGHGAFPFLDGAILAKRRARV